jgi:hypothetical protein
VARDNGIFVAIVQVLGESIDVRVVRRVVPSVYPTVLPALFPMVGIVPIRRQPYIEKRLIDQIQPQFVRAGRRPPDKVSTGDSIEPMRSKLVQRQTGKSLVGSQHELLPFSRLTQASDVSLFVLPDDVILPRRVRGNPPIFDCLI